MFDDVFDKTFKKYVQTDSFRLPMSVKELRLFSLKICQSVLDDFCSNNQSSVSSSSQFSSIQSSPSSPTRKTSRQSSGTSPSKNAPIGINSLSKTFNILKIVGQGNFGKVFKVENKFDHRLFALKQITITPREDLKKVLQEVENLSRAGKHKNIVKYLDCFLIQEEHFDEESPAEADSSQTVSSSSDFTEEKSHPTESVSFISFQEDASSNIKQVQVNVNTSTQDSPETSPKRRKSLSISDIIERPESAGYSKTITCICIKMEFCDFTLDQLMATIKSHRSSFRNTTELFANIHPLIEEFKEDRINAKFGVFSPLFIIKQLLEGLSFLHKLGIVHRDLKPANIFIMNSGSVKIGDFGLSKDLSKESGLPRFYAAGTRFYMAPEFINNQFSVSEEEDSVFPSSDMFSFGMVLVKLLGFLNLDSSEMFRLGDKIRKSFKREIGNFLKSDFIEDLAVGTTQGNLSPGRKSIYLPLLLSFLESMLISVLDPRPRNRLTASKGKQLVEDIFEEIFCGNDFFRPKIGAK